MPTQPLTNLRGTHAASEPLSPPALNAKRTIVGLGLLFAAAFGVTLLATMPATLIARTLKLGDTVPVSGTVWSGEAVLPGGDRLSWRTDAIGSILALGLKADVRITGERSDLTAAFSADGDRLTLLRIEGIAGWSLFRAAWPSIGIDCDMAIRFENATLDSDTRVTAVSGRASAGAGACRTTGVQASTFDVPATQAEASSSNGVSQIRVALASDTAATLAELAIGEAGAFKATLQPLALKMVPGANASGPVVYEMQPR